MTKTTAFPVALPFQDVLKNRRGWQFGLPGARLPNGKPGMPNILTLDHDDRVVLYESPVLTPHDLVTGRPPTPHWAWTPVDTGQMPGGEAAFEMHRVHAPVPGINAAPIAHPYTDERPLYTNYVLEPDGRCLPEFVNAVFAATPFGLNLLAARAAEADLPFGPSDLDLQTDLLVPDALFEHVYGGKEPAEGVALMDYTVRIGSTSICTVYWLGRHVVAIRPRAFAAKHTLWTSHLVTIVMNCLEVKAQHGLTPHPPTPAELERYRY